MGWLADKGFCMQIGWFRLVFCNVFKMLVDNYDLQKVLVVEKATIKNTKE